MHEKNPLKYKKGGIVLQSAFVAQYIVTNVPLPADKVFYAFFCNHFIWFRDCFATQSNNTSMSMRYGKHRNMYFADLLPYYQHSSQFHMFWFRNAASSSQEPSVVVGKHSILC